jgi:hypothetical protein
MAAGLGFKTFTTGEVLTAGDVNGYLMQGINVFASEAARNAAITSPQEGQFAFTKDNNSLWYYDGAAWVASGATGDIEGVTAGVGISGGGTSGTVTVTNSMATAIDAKGDLVPGTGADTFARLAVGANDTVLTADSSTATGLKWATSSSGGYTQLATGSLTGSAVTVSLTMTGYRDLVVNILNPYASTSSTNWQITLGGVSTYQSIQLYSLNGAASATRSTSADNKIEWQFGSLFTIPTSSDNRNSTTLTISNPAATNGKTGQLYLGQAGPSRINVSQAIVLEEGNAITGITFTTTSGSFSGGTYTIYGVK